MNKIIVNWDITSQTPFYSSLIDTSAAPSELSFEDKLAVPEQFRYLSSYADIHITVRGEIMLDPNNLEVLKKLQTVIPRENIALLTSGYGIDLQTACQLSTLVDKVELSADVPPGYLCSFSSPGYPLSADYAIPLLTQSGVYVSVRTQLRTSNNAPEILSAIYCWLCRRQITEWNLFLPHCTTPIDSLRDPAVHVLIQYLKKLDRNNASPTKPYIRLFVSNACAPKNFIHISPNGKLTAYLPSPPAVHIFRRTSSPPCFQGDIRSSYLALLFPESAFCHQQTPPLNRQPSANKRIRQYLLNLLSGYSA